MTGPIVFSNETARQQLEDEGIVYTFRSEKRTTGETWWRKSRTGTKQGDVTVEEVGLVYLSASTMDAYLDQSGFDTVGDWIDAIEELHGDVPDSGYLYVVTEGHNR